MLQYREPLATACRVVVAPDALEVHYEEPVERLWKFVKKQCLYSTYYADFAAFKTAITQCLAQTQTTHRTALDSLLTLRFQLFTKAQFVPA